MTVTVSHLLYGCKSLTLLPLLSTHLRYSPGPLLLSAGNITTQANSGLIQIKYLVTGLRLTDARTVLTSVVDSFQGLHKGKTAGTVINLFDSSRVSVNFLAC